MDHSERFINTKEAMGYSFAIIFGVLNPSQAYELIRHANISAFGIPCLYRIFPLFSHTTGRHNNIIWPMANGFLPKHASLLIISLLFNKELSSLTSLALDEDKGNYEFWEIYNPYTRKPDGGYQAMGSDKPNHHWNSCRLQTWSATAYLNMIIHGLAGMRFNNNSLRFAPCLPEKVHYLKLTDLTYRHSKLSVEITGNGQKIKAFLVNGIPQEHPVIPAGVQSGIEVFIEME
ncbi:MAG: hypothetical protein IPH84_17190 [Bacteroidales bacterium]|nr:hypothetical protein [Bacteroidales bacterium]